MSTARRAVVAGAAALLVLLFLALGVLYVFGTLVDPAERERGPLAARWKSPFPDRPWPEAPRLPEPRAFGSGHFGAWVEDRFGLPAYAYTCDQVHDPKAVTPVNPAWQSPTRHWHQVGNDRLVALASNDGTVQVRQDEGGPKLLNDFDPQRHRFAGGFGYLTDGTGVLATYYPGHAETFERTFGLGYVEKRAAGRGLVVRQVVFAPFGDDPLLVSEVEVENRRPEPADLRWVEYWESAPHPLSFRSFILSLFTRGRAPAPALRRALAASFSTTVAPALGGRALVSTHRFEGERWKARAAWGLASGFLDRFGRETTGGVITAGLSRDLLRRPRPGPHVPRLPRRAGERHDDGRRPLLRKGWRRLARRASRTPRLPRSRGPRDRPPAGAAAPARGRSEDDAPSRLRLPARRSDPRGPRGEVRQGRRPPLGAVDAGLGRGADLPPRARRGVGRPRADLAQLLPAQRPDLRRLLRRAHPLPGTRLPVRDRLPGRGARPPPARPAFRLPGPRSSGRCCATRSKRCRPDGAIPYGIVGHGMRMPAPFSPSDQELWLLWLASEYVLATRDAGLPRRGAPHLSASTGPIRRGRRVASCSSAATATAPASPAPGGTACSGSPTATGTTAPCSASSPRSRWPRSGRAGRASSTPPSPPTCSTTTRRMLEYAGAREGAAAARARARGAAGRRSAAQWTGRWFRRAWLTDALGWIGDDTLWLEPQPWAIIGGAATPEQRATLVASIDGLVRRPSPIGAILHSRPLDKGGVPAGRARQRRHLAVDQRHAGVGPRAGRRPPGLGRVEEEHPGLPRGALPGRLVRHLERARRLQLRSLRAGRARRTWPRPRAEETSRSPPSAGRTSRS